MMHYFADADRFKARLVLGLLVMGVGVLSFGQVADAQSNRDLNNRVNRMENEIETLSRALFRGENPSAGAVSGASDAARANAEIRLSQLESELRSIRGQIEQQDFQMRELRSELERVKGDLELRVNDLEGARAGQGGSSQGGGQNNGAAKYINRSPSLTNGSQGGGDVRSPVNGGGYQWKSGDASSNQLGTYKERGNTGAISDEGDLAAATYENAFSLLKQEKYVLAEKEFQVFLNEYPDHVLAGNAKYWLGETFYVRGDFQRAARLFAEGFQKYPNNSKAADNLLKLGMSLASLDKKDDACVALSQIEKEGFKASAPVLRRASQEKSRLGC